MDLSRRHHSEERVSMLRHASSRLAALALADCRASAVSHARLPPSLTSWRTAGARDPWTEVALRRHSTSSPEAKREANAAAARRARLAATTARGQGSAASGGLYLAALAIGMVGVTYASVPLYRMFCQATGFGGTTRRRTLEDKLSEQSALPESVKTAAANREVVISFNADVAEGMPWRFVPTQKSVKVKPGETTLAFFTAKNRSDGDITGVATYNVQPNKAGSHFNKVQCFCFEEQRLRAGEEVDMPVFFYLDPEFASDPAMVDVNDVMLSYTFFRSDDFDELEEEEERGATVGVKVHGTGTVPPGIKGHAALW